MVEVAVRLLCVNYDLPDASWTALLRFEAIPGMLVLSAETTLIVAQACEDWGPLIAATRPDVPEACSLN